VRNCFNLIAILIIAVAFTSGNASAQSSGNFTATITTTQCTMNTTPGSTGGALNPGTATPTMMLDTYIKTPNSQFTTLLITPSLVTGLFNNTQVSQDMPTSGNSAAVKVFVTLDDKAVSPDTGGLSPIGVIYDQRFQQLSAPFFGEITECAMNNNCSLDLVLSTLAAHSFNFVAPNVGGGVHHLKVYWNFECTDNSGAMTPCTMAYTTNSAGACAGPGSVTVTQVKTFSQSSGVVIGN